MLWPALTVIDSAHAAGIKAKGRTLALNSQTPRTVKFCNLLTPEQRLQLATMKEKREAKKLDSTPSKDSDTLVDPASVSLIGAIDDQGTVKSPTVAPPEKKI